VIPHALDNSWRTVVVLSAIEVLGMLNEDLLDDILDNYARSVREEKSGMVYIKGLTMHEAVIVSDSTLDLTCDSSACYARYGIQPNKYLLDLKISTEMKNQCKVNLSWARRIVIVAEKEERLQMEEEKKRYEPKQRYNESVLNVDELSSDDEAYKGRNKKKKAKEKV
jgi:hypothetical protein